MRNDVVDITRGLFRGVSYELYPERALHCVRLFPIWVVLKQPGRVTIHRHILRPERFFARLQRRAHFFMHFQRVRSGQRVIFVEHDSREPERL